MAYLRTRNPNIDPRFDGLATAYMRYGEQMGIRWDIAFFQMILETGALRYNGDVRADQNNFAGLGASGRGKHGERFPDIASGVQAHLQHLLMYAGEHIDNPIAERTRKVQDWGVLTDWQNSVKGPMTFKLLAQQWAPGSRRYARDIAAITNEFYQGECNAPDPQPELVQEARKGREPKAGTQVAAATPDVAPANIATTQPDEPSGAEIAQRAIEQARKEDPPRTGLGASGMLGSVAQTAKQTANAAATPPKANAQPAVTLINPSKSETAQTASKAATTPPAVKPEASKIAATTKTTKTTKTATAKADTVKAGTAKAGTAKAHTAKAGPSKDAEIQTASVAGAATQLKVPSAKSSAKCKVWTASYGGQRAILIKASTKGTVNYTVLDVNASSEKREVDAYIAAYAKGGERVAAFPNQTQALDKAFELCPEG